jgi:hypothetical protein
VQDDPKNSTGCDACKIPSRIISHATGRNAAVRTDRRCPFSVSQLSKRINMRIPIRHGLGPLRTTDSPRHDDLGSALAEIEISLGVLDPSDLAKLRAILQKYCAGSSATTNATGITRAGDSLDAADAAGRQAAAKARGQAEHIQAVANSYRTFWDARNQELRDSVRR